MLKKCFSGTKNHKNLIIKGVCWILYSEKGKKKERENVLVYEVCYRSESNRESVLSGNIDTHTQHNTRVLNLKRGFF